MYNTVLFYCTAQYFLVDLYLVEYVFCDPKSTYPEVVTDISFLYNGSCHRYSSIVTIHFVKKILSHFWDNQCFFYC